MGKIRVKKSRLHLKATSAANDTWNGDTASAACTNATEEKQSKTNLKYKSIPIEQNPFTGVKISITDLLKNQPQALLDEPAKTKESRIKITPLLPKKKGRMKQRREAFLKKLEVAQNVEIEKKKAKKRSKTPVVGDMHWLKMALQDVTEETKINVPEKNLSVDNKEVNKKKTRRSKQLNKIDDKNTNLLRRKPTSKSKQKNKPQKHMIDEVIQFQKILKSKEFQKDSKLFIVENIKRNNY